MEQEADRTFSFLRIDLMVTILPSSGAARVVVAHYHFSTLQGIDHRVLFRIILFMVKFSYGAKKFPVSS